MVLLHSTATGTLTRRSTEIIWDQFINGTIISDVTLVAIVTALDSGRARVTSATFSGSTVQNMELVTQTITPGGKGYPNTYMFALPDPVAPIDSVTGEVKVQFNELVNVMGGISGVFIGVDTTNPVLSGGVGRVFHTQPPDFEISDVFTTTVTGAMVIDVCFSESSSHNDHDPGEEQVVFGDISFPGPHMTTSYRSAPTATGIVMSRKEVGGPHAGAALTIMALRGT